MIIAVFRSRVHEEFREEFDRLYAEMSGHIKKISGYLGHKVFTAPDGEQVVIVEFKDKDAFLEWDVHPDHKRAKERGKSDVFTEYDVAVAEIFERHRKD